jgi:heat shock protein HslJ
MRKARYLLPFLALLGMIAAVGACPALASAADTHAPGNWPHNRTFRAVSLVDHGHARAIVPGTTILLTFSGHNRVSARAGCNSGSATGSVVAHRLVLRGLVTTRMACAPARMLQDAFLASVLTSRPHFRLTTDGLTLTNGSSQIRLVDA